MSHAPCHAQPHASQAPARAPDAPWRRPEPALRIAERAARSPGVPLDPHTRQHLEPRLGHDFSRVRIHADEQAARAAQAVGARAFTFGNHVVFGEREFTPSTLEGRRLIAHELTHVAQQQSGSPWNGNLPPQPATTPAAEQEAQAAAETLTHGGTTPRVTRTPVAFAADDKKESTATQRFFHYDRSNFNDAFDGIVDRTSRQVTLRMSLDFEDMGRPEGKEARINKFKARAKQVIEETWSGVRALRSVCHGSQENFEARVRVDTSGASAHHTIHVWPDIAGARSNSTNWKENANDWQERTSAVQPDPKKPPVEATFYQRASAHEFGHLMGLKHIHCEASDDRCYGVTGEQKMDIMGMGSVVSERDYEPFVRIMKRFGQDTLPASCNAWKLVAPGDR